MLQNSICTCSGFYADAVTTVYAVASVDAVDHVKCRSLIEVNVDVVDYMQMQWII